jgi:hypothetical protein
MMLSSSASDLEFLHVLYWCLLCYTEAMLMKGAVCKNRVRKLYSGRLVPWRPFSPPCFIPPLRSQWATGREPFSGRIVGCMAPGCRTLRQTWWLWLTNGAPTPTLSRRVSRGSGCAIAGQTCDPPLCRSSFFFGASWPTSSSRRSVRILLHGGAQLATPFPPSHPMAPVAPDIWQSKAPYSCKFFTWLAARNRCWTEEGRIAAVCPTRRPALYATKNRRPSSTSFSAVRWLTRFGLGPWRDVG